MNKRELRNCECGHDWYSHDEDGCLYPGCGCREYAECPTETERLRARVAELEGVVQAAMKLNAEYKVLDELGDAPIDYRDMQNELCADLYRRLMSAVDALEAAECAKMEAEASVALDHGDIHTCHEDCPCHRGGKP